MDVKRIHVSVFNHNTKKAYFHTILSVSSFMNVKYAPTDVSSLFLK